MNGVAWQDRLYTVTCPTCLNERIVTRIQHWQITSPKGRSSGQCKSCSLIGNKYNKDQERPNNAKLKTDLAKELYNTRIYRIWSGIKTRCFNENRKDWMNYGGRGIQMCERWRESFDAFVEDMYATYQDDLSIDRIDVNGNYEPDNCRWATPHEQANNTRKTIART